MNFEQEERVVLLVIERACAKIGVAVRTEVGEYCTDEVRSKVLFYYDHEFRKRRTSKIASWLWIFSIIYYISVSLLKEDGATFLPFFNVVFSALTVVDANYQHVATTTERNLAIQLALNEAGFAVYMTDESFEVFM